MVAYSHGFKTARRRDILQMRSDGLSHLEIGSRFGISPERVGQIITGDRTSTFRSTAVAEANARLDALLSEGTITHEMPADRIAALAETSTRKVRQWRGQPR